MRERLTQAWSRLREGLEGLPARLRAGSTGSSRSQSDIVQRVMAWFKGGRRFVLSIGDDGAVLLYMSGNSVRYRAFAPSADPADTEPLDELLARDPNTPVRPVVDILDQSYRQDHVPQVPNPFDVSKLVKRKLDLVFPGDNVRGAVFLDRSEASEGGTQRNYMFCAVPTNETLAPWIEWLRQKPNPRRGMVLLPLEAVSLADELGEVAGLTAEPEGSRRPHWRLLLSRHRTGGFRQVVTRNGRMIFTRLTQGLPFDAPARDVAESMAREFRMTTSYLKRLTYTPEDRLDLLILTNSDVAEELAEQDIPASEIAVLSPNKAAESMGFDGVADPDDDFGEVLQAAWAATRTQHRLVLRPQRLKTDYVAVYGVRAAAATATLAFLGAMATGAQEAWRAYKLEDTLESMRVQQKNVAIRLKNKKEALGKYPVSAETLTTAVETWKTLEAARPRLDDLLPGLAAALGEDVRLTRLKFDTGSRVKTASGGGGGRRRGRGGGGGPAVSPARPNVDLHLQLPGADGILEKAVTVNEETVARLRDALPQWEVSVARPPANLLPGQTLSGRVNFNGGGGSGTTYKSVIALQRSAPRGE